MSRPVVHRLLPKAWVPVQQSEHLLRGIADHLRGALDDCTCTDCQSAREDTEQAAEMLEVCADDLRARWLPHEQGMGDDDLLLVEMVGALFYGDRPLPLPEAGVRIISPGGTHYMRFADSTSDDEPELILPPDGLLAT